MNLTINRPTYVLMRVFEGGKTPGNWQTPLINVLASYLTKLDLGEPVDLDELVDAAEGGLALAGDQVGADAEAVDGVALVGDDVAG